MKLQQLYFAEGTSIDQQGKISAYGLLPDYLVLSHCPEVDRPVTMSFAMVFILSGKGLPDSLPLRILGTSPSGVKIIDAFADLSNGQVHPASRKNIDGLMSIVSNVDFRNFAFTEKGEYSFTIDINGEKTQKSLFVTVVA